MSELVLRDYQTPIVGGVREALRQHRSVLLQLPTGGGKTAIASYIAKETAARSKRVHFICHRVELVDQTSLTWRKYGLAHGFVVAGMPQSTAFANICSIDTLKRRLLTTPEPDIAIWDECHHLGAAGWQAVKDHWRNARHIGLSATPWRLDGTGLGRYFETMVQGPTIAELMARGYLAQYELYAPDPPDMRGARKVAGDYTRSEASKRMNLPKRIGDIIAHWRRNAEGMLSVLFAVNVADSLLCVERFNNAGIPAAHLDADTPKELRRKLIQDFAERKLLVLSNVGLFGEGFDLSAIAQRDVTIDCLIDAAPSQSLSAVMQRWGRVLRPKPYPAVINDHAGNSNKHGFPDDERDWSLADRPRFGKGGDGDEGTSGPPPPYTCVCFRQIRRPLPSHCPHCGVAIVPDAKPVREGEGELTKRTAADRAAIRKRLRAEEQAATTLHQLADLARRRGYKNPTGWAFRKWSNSSWRQRLAKEQAEKVQTEAEEVNEYEVV